MTTIFRIPSWPVCKVELNEEEMFYVGFSKETVLGIGNEPIIDGSQNQKSRYELLKQYNGHIPVAESDILDGQKIESGPGYLLDAESLKKYLEGSYNDVAEIIQKIGDKLNSEKSKELRENLTSYETAYEEIFGVEIKQNN